MQSFARICAHTLALLLHCFFIFCFVWDSQLILLFCYTVAMLSNCALIMCSYFVSFVASNQWFSCSLIWFFVFAVNLKVRHQSFTFRGHIVYSRTVPEVEESARELLHKIKAMEKNMEPVSLGFDIEWKPAFGRGLFL